VLITLAAQAYCNHGRWVADCPRPYCGNAIALATQADARSSATVRAAAGSSPRWSGQPNADRISEVLQERPVPGTRNWAPPGHRQAIACNVAEGQTVADLIAENNEYGRL
jgi:hypothetical protein